MAKKELLKDPASFSCDHEGYHSALAYARTIKTLRERRSWFRRFLTLVPGEGTVGETNIRKALSDLFPTPREDVIEKRRSARIGPEGGCSVRGFSPSFTDANGPSFPNCLRQAVGDFLYFNNIIFG